MCTKLVNMIWIFLALIVAPIIGCRKAAEVDTSDTKMPVRIVARPPGARDKVSFEIEESDDLASFRQITKGMRVEKVKQILKDFQYVSIGSGFAIEAYTLDDQSVVEIWYDKGCVFEIRHNNKPMSANREGAKKSAGQKKGDAAH